MIRQRWPLVLGTVVLTVFGSGCQGLGRRNAVAMQDAPLSSPELIQGGGDDLGVGVIEARQVSWVDRHPLFYKPGEWYERGGPGPVRAVAAATFIGVPAGVLGEARQIVVGCPVRP